MKSKKFKIIPLLRLIIFGTLCFSYIYWHVSRWRENPFATRTIHFFSNQCDDEFSKMIQKEISKAQKSIFLSVYSLQDQEISQALDQKADLEVNIITDAKTGKPPLNSIIPILKQSNSLMHQKILILDNEKILIGSANFTPDSLCIDDNLIASISSKTLASAIFEGKSATVDSITYWPLPAYKKEALETLCHYLENAKKSIQVVMFTWTHPDLTNQIITAKKRGVNVRIFLDYKSAIGTSKKTVESLQKENIEVFLSPSQKTLHHKMVLIDESILFFGSANWTKAAFSKNDESLLMIQSLDTKQKKKLKKLLHATQCETRRLPTCSRS